MMAGQRSRRSGGMADMEVEEGPPRLTSMLRHAHPTACRAVALDAGDLVAGRARVLQERRRASAFASSSTTLPADAKGKGKATINGPTSTSTTSSSLAAKFASSGSQKEYQKFIGSVRSFLDADFSLEELQAEAEQVAQILGPLTDAELGDRRGATFVQKHRVLQQRYGPFDARQFAEVCDTFSRLRARHAEGKPAGAPGGSARVGGGGGAREFGAEVLDFVFPGKKYVSVTGSVAAGQNNAAAAATAGATFVADSKPVDEFGDMTKKLKGLFSSSSTTSASAAFDRGEAKVAAPVKSQGLSATVGTKVAKASEPNLSDSLETLLWFTDLCSKRDEHATLVNVYSIVVGDSGADVVGAELYELLGDSAIEMISEISQSLLEIRAKLKVCLLYAYRKDQEAKKDVGGGHSNNQFGQQFTIVSEREQEIKKGALKASRKKNSRVPLPKLLSWLQTVGIDYLLQLVTEEPDPSPRDVPVMKDPAEFDLDDYVGKGSVTIAQGLPPNAVRKKFKNWEEVFVPAKLNDPGAEEPRVQITEMEKWARLAFKGYKELNRIQSRIYETAYNSNENLLVCAPTGAGKTNIAMISILHEVKKHIVGGMLEDPEFKVVYIAPMKALAAEVTATFSKRLAPLGISVRECTGDIQLSKRELAQTQMIVTTPEKWDVITRKGGDVSAAAQVKLLILDEVHLLNDERGAVIETLVARTQRQVEVSQSMIRIVGLSATLPSYKDVASFLGVNVDTGLFYFDHSYRPVPLDTHFFGVNERNFAKRELVMNEIAFEKAMKSIEEGYQVMVFVHSRKKTAMGGRAFVELAAKAQQLDVFDADLDQQQQKELQKSRNKELQELVPKAIATHHAGMLRSDRNLAEKLFRDGKIKVLFCTATLAWGVNLPVHAVIIKGTQVYDANKGGFKNIGILDVLQIFGRAGRPQYDTSGEAMIITTDDQLHHYIGSITNQVPIESKFVSSMVDNLNAEIVLGTVSNVREACVWLSYTYLYTRMRKNPLAYGITWNAVYDDPALSLPRREIVTNAARTLHECKMTVFDQKSGNLYITELGRIASLYYLKHSSMALYNEKLNPHMTDADVIEMISQVSCNLKDDLALVLF